MLEKKTATAGEHEGATLVAGKLLKSYKIGELSITEDNGKFILSRHVYERGVEMYSIVNQAKEVMFKAPSLEDALEYWKRIYTKVRAAERKVYFDGIIAEVNKQKKKEDYKQMDIFEEQEE